MKRYWYSIAIALMGVLIGALSVVVIYSSVILFAPRKTVQYHEWDKLYRVLESLRDNYVDTINYDAVTEAAIKAALDELDPHSVYLPPVDLEESESSLNGQFEGIGIQFNVPADTAIVLEVIAGGPAEKVGMLKGDKLLKVDEKMIAGVQCPQDSMVARMKGPSGTKVTVTVLRDGVIIPFEITRAKIRTTSIDANFMLNDTLAYIRVSKFAATTCEEFAAAASKLLKQGTREMIVDLRDNTGGYFSQGLTLSSFFFDNREVVVYLEGLHRQREIYRADRSGFLTDMPLKVLINEGTASSSEIFAGAIQDNDRGVIIGRRSFGKGLVQEPIYFTDNSAVRLTVARFYSPSGRCIQKPYSDDYAYDIYKRYADGEMIDADSIKVNEDLKFFTAKGRPVYGGGGIIPDVFVPLDTTRVTDFHLAVNKKATAMRFASSYFEAHKKELSEIDDYNVLLSYLDRASLDKAFLDYASSNDGIRPADDSEWEQSRPYVMTTVRALVGRYSKLGEQAFYHIYAEIDPVIIEALKPHSIEIPSE